MNARKITKARRVTQGSVSLRCQLAAVIAPKVETAPTWLSVIPLDRKEVPYAFRKPYSAGGKVSKNEITAPIEPTPEPRVLEQGCETVLISCFRSAEERKRLVTGNVYRLEGLYLDAYQDENMAEPRYTLQCSDLSDLKMAHSEVAETVMGFDEEARSLLVSRDCAMGNVTEYTSQPKVYRFVHLTLGEEARFCKMGGSPELMYQPLNSAKQAEGSSIYFLNGGREGQEILPAQLVIKTSDGEITGLCKIYQGRGLEYFQMQLQELGWFLPQYMEGDLYCTVDREESSRYPSDEPVVYLNVTIRPDLAQTVRNVGVKVGLSAAEKLGISDWARMAGGGSPQRYNLGLQNAVNLSWYAGDAALIPAAVEKKWVELYVACKWGSFEDDNVDEALTNARGMGEDALVEVVKKKKGLAIFAVPTADSPCPVYTFLSATGEKAEGGKWFEETKRAKEEEEEME